MKQLQVVFFVLIGIINIFLSQLPLTNTVHYEFSAANAILLFLFGGILSIKLHNKYELDIGIVYDKLKLGLLLLIAIPFIIGSISTIFFSTCPFSRGILFYIVITIPSLLFGFITGSFINVIVWRLRYLIFIITFIIILFIPLIEFYFNPQIYFYNPIFGYYPGTIYDEDLSVNSTLLLYRSFNILFFGLLGFYSYLPKLKKKINRIQALLLLLVITSLFFLFKPVLSYSTDFNKMKNKLGKVLYTDHFNIYYSEKIDSGNSIELLGLKHEYYYEQVKNALTLSTKNRITSFVFLNSNQKRELFGAGNADVAKPWLRQIYLNYPSYNLSLKHELVHILAGEFGTTPFLVSDNLSTALLEGLAMAIENDYDGNSVHYMAKTAYQAGYKFPVTQLFNGFNFFSQYSSISYIYAGSFIKYLIETYGIEPVKSLYSDQNFEKYIGKSIAELESDYLKFLDSYKIDFNKDKARLYFGGQPIFQKYCARTTAHETKTAWKLFNDKKYEEAKELFDKVYGYSGAYSPLHGLVNSKTKLNKTLEAEFILVNEINKFQRSSGYFNLELILGDIFIRNNKINEARNLYDSLLTQNPHIEFTNQVMIRKRLMDDNIDSLKKYINGDTKERHDLLKRINEKEILSYTVSTIINYANKTSYKEIVNSFYGKISTNEIYSIDAINKLAEISIEIGEYDTAKNLLVKALELNEFSTYEKRLTENLKFVNWLINFSDETKSRFRYE